jgi:DNA polymerase/3'-5' exonuclease PolX
MSTHIQSVIFNRDKWSLSEAKKYIQNDSKFVIAKPPHVTDRFIRFRQVEPDYDSFYYKTLKRPNGIEFIVGYPKSHSEKVGNSGKRQMDKIQKLEKRQMGGMKNIPYIDLKNAKMIANRIIKQFAKKGIKLHIAGSVARKEPQVKDIDFITRNKLSDNRKYIKELLMPTINGKMHHVNIDIWHHKSLLFGKLLRSYPYHVAIALRKGLKNKGYKMGSNDITKNGKKVPIKTMKQVFNLAGIKYRKI